MKRLYPRFDRPICNGEAMQRGLEGFLLRATASRSERVDVGVRPRNRQQKSLGSNEGWQYRYIAASDKRHRVF